MLSHALFLSVLEELGGVIYPCSIPNVYRFGEKEMSSNRLLRLACVLVRRIAESVNRRAEAWLDPNGNLNPVKFSHDQWAAEHGKTIEELFDEGWLRITGGYKEVIVENLSPPVINWKQKQKLVDFALESKWFTSVIDSSSGRDVVLWSSEDRL